MVTRRLMAAPAIAFALLTAGPATAQQASLVGAVDRPAPPAARGLPDFSPPAGDLRRVGEPRRNGLIAAWPVTDNLDIAVGRFAIPELPRARTNMEAERNPTSVRPRERGMAAVGFSLRF